MKRHRKTCEAWQARDKKAVRNQRRKATSLERYGVEDAAHAPEVQARRAATNLAKYGAENPFCKEASTFDKVQASLEGKRPVLRGADNPFAKPEVKAKIRDHWMQEHGVENPQQVAGCWDHLCWRRRRGRRTLPGTAMPTPSGRMP
jgi:hypothetical protein